MKRQFGVHSAENWSLVGPPTNPQPTSDNTVQKSSAPQAPVDHFDVDGRHLGRAAVAASLLCLRHSCHRPDGHCYLHLVQKSSLLCVSLWQCLVSSVVFGDIVPLFGDFCDSLRRFRDKVSVFSHQKLHFSTAIFQRPAKWSWRPPRNFELSRGSSWRVHLNNCPFFRPTVCYSRLSKCVHLVMMSRRCTF